MTSSNEVDRSEGEEDPFYLEKYVRPEMAARVAALLKRNKETEQAKLNKNDTKPREDGENEPTHGGNHTAKSQQQQPGTPTTMPTPPTPPDTASRRRSVSIPSGGDSNWSRSPGANSLHDLRKVVKSRMKMCDVAKWVRSVAIPAPVERSPESSHHSDGYSIGHKPVDVAGRKSR